MFDFSYCSADSKYYDDSDKLVVGEMEDGTGGTVIKKFAGLKPKIYLFLVDDSNDHKKAKRVNKNVVATISYGEYKDVLLNKKCLRRSMNRIQREN